MQLGLQGQVLFTGYLDRATELLDCYRAGDVFTFASKTETQGLVLLEAMAQALPVVSLSELGANDILGANQGVLVATENIHEFAGKVSQLLAEPALRARLSQEGLAYARTWSARSFAEKMAQFYETSLHNRRLN
jgi:glycosyltransferase involved in cell wall biosynthesis